MFFIGFISTRVSCLGTPPRIMDQESCDDFPGNNALRIRINPLPNNKTMDWSKVEAFPDERINVTKNLDLLWGRVENILGKGQNYGYQHFLLFPQKATFSRSVLCGKVLKPLC